MRHPRLRQRPFVTLGVAAGFLVLAAVASADLPEIKGISPYGAQRGVAVDLLVTGSNLKGGTKLIAPFKFSLDPATAAQGDAGNWKPKITVAPDTPLGVYIVRLQTDEGLSNPFLFSVGQLAQVAEKEDNSTFETAQVISTPAVVEGQAAGNDVDFFKFSGKKGQRIIVDAQCSRIGSGIDPSIRLTTASRAFVASADDSPGLLTDARLAAVLPADGDYVIELSDSRYQGGDRAIYRLVVGAVPVAEEVFPLGGRQGETVGFELRGGTLPETKVVAETLNPPADSSEARLRANNLTLGLAGPGEPMLEVESAPSLVVSKLPELREPTDPAAAPVKAAPPVAFNGRIDPAGDEDRYVLSVTPGQKLRLHVQAADIDSALDGQMQILGAKNAVLATADDTNLPPIVPSRKNANKKTDAIVSPDPSQDFTVPSGVNEITVVVRDLEGRGGIGFPYRLTVEPIVPTFDLLQDDAQVSIPKGGTVALDFVISRKGYNGPITLNVPNPPAGLKVRPGKVADGQAVGVLTLTAAADASFGPTELKIVGEAQGPDGPFTVLAHKFLIFAQQGNLPTNYVRQENLPTALSPAGPVTLETAEAPVEVVHGYEAPVPVKVARAKDADGALDLATLALPPGLTLAAAKIAEKANEGSMTAKVGTDAALGLMSVAITAKGKVANKNVNLAAPAVTLNVIRPAELQLAAPNADVKAGETFELKGKVVRKGPFKEPVTIKVNGLPAGTKADPVTVAPEAGDFVVKIVAEAGAAEATATAQVTASFQINKKDYPNVTAPLAVKLIAAKK